MDTDVRRRASRRSSRVAVRWLGVLLVAASLAACGGGDGPGAGGGSTGLGTVASAGGGGGQGTEGGGGDTTGLGNVTPAGSGEGAGATSSPGGGGLLGSSGGGGLPPAASQDVTCKDYDGNPVSIAPKTITINNDSKSVIYPALSVSNNAVNEWLQGCFRDMSKNYPTKDVTKVYVNQDQGIPPGSSVTLTLPLYDQLDPDTYITWWNGGRVVLADKNIRLDETNPEAKEIPVPGNVTCTATNTTCALTVYQTPVGFKADLYAQLSEYTFGDSVVPVIDKKAQPRLLVPDNVGYNISYVDNVYMPVAIEPAGNPYIGYSGSTMDLAKFQKTLTDFLATPLGTGWPLYNLSGVRLPSGNNVFQERKANEDWESDMPVRFSDLTNLGPLLSVQKCMDEKCTPTNAGAKRFGRAVQRMQNLWGSCVNWGNEDLSPYVTKKFVCPLELGHRMQVVKRFFAQNYANYQKLWNDGKCVPKDQLAPVLQPFNFWTAVTHIMGWVPFNEYCGAGANRLADTVIPGWDHAKVQNMYIHELQYNYQQPDVEDHPRLTFNPYVKLIHKDLGMGAYAFSVDDAVGFMSELGSGLVFAVGGDGGLANTGQFSYAGGFTLNMGPPKGGAPNKAAIKSYGVCEGTVATCTTDKEDVTLPTGTQILGFRVGTVASYPIVVHFTDMDGNVYTVPVMEKFVACPSDGKFPCERDRIPNASQIVDLANCSVHIGGLDGPLHPKSATWCDGVSPNEQKESKEAQVIKNYLTFPVPVDSLP